MYPSPITNRHPHTASAERKAEAQPLGSGGAEADDVLLSVTVIMPGAAAVASSDWFSDPNVSLSKHSGQLARELAATAGVVTALETQTLCVSASSRGKNRLAAKERKDRKERTTPNSTPVNANVRLSLNAKVSDRSQPPLTFDLSLRESAGSDSLDRLVRPWSSRLRPFRLPSACLTLC